VISALHRQTGLSSQTFRRPYIISTALSVANFRFLETAPKNLNSIHEEMKENERGRCGIYGVENKSTKIFFGGRLQGK